MEIAGITCCPSGALLTSVASQQHSTTALASPRSTSASFTSRSLKSSSLFGESLRIMPRSSLKVSKTKNSAFVTKCEIGDSLEEFLTKATPDKGLIRLMMCMGEAIRTIAYKVRTASCGGTACINSFGDEQLAVDMLADKLLFEALTYSHFCKYACSEEVPELQDMGGPVEGGFSVAFDPLDGSSIVDTNFTVGTIFGVWPGDKLTGITGRDQVAAAMGIYGPRTTYVIALKDSPGTHEFLLLDEGKWQHVKDTTEIGEGKMFSPGNLRATADNPDYKNLINYYVKEKYTLRYTGGMVPDVNQENKAEIKKWRGSVGGIVDAPIDKVWTMVSKTSRLPEWMPMIEKCTDLAGEDGVPGYVRLVSGFMFPQEDGDRSWIKERLVSIEPLAHSYVYKMEASNVGLDGSVNSLKLLHYGENSTLVDWSFEIDPLEGASEEKLIDYLGFLYKSCINRIEAAMEASSQKVV